MTTEPTSPRTLVLHIGAHKTGSSAIQSFLKQNRETLESEGWSYCTLPGRPLNWGFLFDVAKRDEGAAFSLLPEVFARLLAQIDAGTGNVILSIEDLFFLDSANIAIFTSAMTKRFAAIRVITYLRRQDQMAMSHWAQGAKTIQSALIFGKQDYPLPALTPAVRDYLDYAALIERWKRALPDASFVLRLYDRDQFENRDVIADFLVASGIDIPATHAISDVNASMGASSVRLLYLLRNAGLGQKQIRRLVNGNEVPQTKDKVYPSRAEAEAFVAAFAESNQRLAEMAGRETFFAQDFSAYPETAEMPPLDPAFVQDSLLKFLVNTAKLVPAAALEPGTTRPGQGPGKGPGKGAGKGPAGKGPGAKGPGAKALGGKSPGAKGPGAKGQGAKGPGRKAQGQA